MKREVCPFCAHRWIRKSDESPIVCPGCRRKYLSRKELIERQRNE